MAVEPSGISRDGTRETALVGAYLDGNMSRRTFVRRLLAAGVSLSAAVAYTHALKPSAARANHHPDHYEEPTLLTTDASNLSDKSATLNGQVDPNSYVQSSGAEGWAWFEYGKTTDYGQTTPEQPIMTKGSLVPIAATIGGLERGATYHFRVVARNRHSLTRVGADKTFTTPDTKRPKLGFTPVDSKIALVRRKRRLRVKITVDEPVALRLRASVRVRVRRPSGKTGFKRIVVAKWDGEVARAGSRNRALKLTKAGRKYLKGRGGAKLTLNGVATDPSGNRATVKGPIQLS